MNKQIFLKTIAIAVLTIGLSHAQAQAPPDTLWTQTFGASNIDIGYDVKQTNDMGFITTGYTRSYGTTSGRNAWLVKTDADGNLQWHNTYGGNNDDEGHAVEQTSDGGFIMAGHTKSFGAGGMDVLLIKTDANGNQEWMKTFGGSHDDEGYSVLQTSDGGFVVAGATTSFGAGSRDMWLIKTDPEGNLEWSQTLGGMSSDGAWSVVQTSDGGFALAGWTFSHGPAPIGNAWLVKTDASGNQLWHRAFGGSSVDRAHDVKQVHDGGFILTGYTASSGAGLDDMLLIRTDGLGNEIWTKTFGGSGRDYGQSVIQTADQDGFIVAGYTLSYGMGSEDLWLVRTDMNGDLIWQYTLGGSSADVAHTIQQTANENFIVAGYTLSFGAGVHDLWLVKLTTDLTSVPNQGSSAADKVLQPVYPNPSQASAVIPFNLARSSHVTLKLFDPSGRLLQTLLDATVDAGAHQVKFDALDLPAGVYLFRIESKDFAETGKMILLK